MAADPPPFNRERYTWLAYLMLAYFSYLQASLGPVMPFLRDELHLNYTVTGLHLSAFALGMVLAGAIGDRLVRRWGRRRVLWGGGAGMAAGGLLFILGRHAGVTVMSALLMGLPGTLVMIMVQATLSDKHGERRVIALTESNVMASTGAGLAPLLVGGLQRIGIGWRGAPLLAVLTWVLLALRFHAEPVPLSASQPDRDHPQARSDNKLPLLFWAYWILVFLGVSFEWCMIFWGATFLENSIGLGKVTASTLMGVFFVAMIIGRATGSRLSRRVPVGTLLLSAIVVALVGFFPFWLASSSALNIAGLVVAGLGIANLFPLTMAAATSVVKPHQVDTASSRITLIAGLAILITPQALGSLADQVGIESAYSVAACFLVLAAGAAFVASWLALASKTAPG